MPFRNRYTATTRGCITITGNTLGLSKSTTGALTPGISDAIGGFITTNVSIPTATGWTSIVNLANYENITLDWTQNSSSAKLNILDNSTILYAELIWGGNYNLGNQTIENVSNYINNSIKFTVPEGRTYNIAPDSLTAYTVSPFYSRSANVTSLISSSGTYTVGAVPAALSTTDISGACAGWSLIVVYSNISLPIRNMTVFSGGESVSSETVDTTISGFATPVNGTVNARVLVSSIEGDANRIGDYMQFGPNSSNLKKLYGPNNWASPPNSNDNFFNSQINIGDPNSVNVGKIDTTGTFGNRNANTSQAVPANISGGRQGWSITNVDGSAAMSNNQTSALVRLATAGDVYVANAFAVQIDSAYTTINMQKNTTDTLIVAGQTIHYTLTVSNTGTLATNDFLVYDPALTGETIDVSSITISGVTGSITNNSTPTGISIQIGPLIQNQTVTISYNVITSSQTVFPIQNTAYGQYTYTPAAGVSPITDTKRSNIAITNGVRVNQSKSVSNNQAVNGDVITYTVSIDNTASSVEITNVSLVDMLQTGTTYVLNSTVIGSNSPINSNPNSGINIGTIPAYSNQTVSFNVLVSSPPASSPITNTANITFTGAKTTITQSTNTTSVSIINPNMSALKSVDKSLAQVGDTLTYTTVITNTGDTLINNIIFNDPPPANTIYDGSGVTIDGVLYPSVNPTSAIDFSTISIKSGTFPLYPSKSIVVSYTVVITSTPASSQINNIASITSQYKVGSQQRTATIISNTVTTNLFKLNIIKTTNRNALEPGDLLTYTITITSTRPGTYANDIIFIDNLPPNVTIIPGNTVVNGATVVANNSTTTQLNLNFGNTFPNNPIIITSTVKVGLNASTPLQNIASVKVGTVSTNSNMVSTEVANPRVTKSSSKSYITVGQTYTYTVTIDNTGNNIVLTDVYVYDQLQTGTSYVNNSTRIGNSPPINSDPSYLKGIRINTVAANTLLTVSFDVIVDSLPSQNPILNTATINYNLDSIEKSKTSNQTKVNARLANLTINKDVDKQYSDIGDIITYTISTTNTGNVSADSVTITDSIPVGTTLEAGSIVVKDKFDNPVGFTSNIQGNQLKIILNNSISLSDSVITTFKVKVDSTIPSTNPITNNASINFYYTVDPTSPPISVLNTSNSVNTQIYHADLISTGNFTKTVSKQYADVGDILTYTIVAKNTGNTDANNVAISDVIPSGTSLVEGSMTSTIPYTGDNIQNGITLTAPISPGGAVTITYQGKIDVIPNPNPITNLANINYTYTVNPLNPNGASASGVTNIATTKVNNANIGNHDNFNKSVDKTSALVGDTLTYTITVSNTGSTTANNIIVIDAIPSGATFKVGTTMVDGISTNENPATGINIDKIDVGVTVIITYQVTVTSMPSTNPMANIANVTYSYIIDPTETPPVIANGNGTTHQVYTSISRPNLIGLDDFTKSVDKQYATVGDILTYRLTIHNSSQNLTANNVVIKDPPPNNTNFKEVVHVIDKITSNPINYTGDLETIGITITNGIAPKQTIEIVYELTVSSLPNPNNLLNYATLDYTYTGGSGNIITNTTATEIFTADLKSSGNSIKKVNKEFSYVGDVLTYYISIKNTGNTSANNVVIKDSLPSEVSLVLGSLVVDNPYTGDDIVTGITLVNPIQSNEVIDIVFQVNVDKIPITNPIENYANISYEYTVDPSLVNGENDNLIVGPATTTINFADLKSNFSKSVNEQYIDINGVLIYEIRMINIGNTKANNVLITDTIPIGTTFIDIESVTDLLGNTIAYSGDLENTPIYITDGIDYNNGVIITFKVEVDSIPPTNYVLNTAKVDYDFILNNTTTPVTKVSDSGVSNQTSTRVNNANLSEKFIKSVDKQYADIGDTLTYTIQTTNIGNIATLNTTDDNYKVVIKDAIPKETTLLQSTINIIDGNGEQVAYKLGSEELTIILLNPVDVGNTVVITYQVKVDEAPKPNTIINASSIEYSYEVNPVSSEIITVNNASEVKTIVNNADLSTDFIKKVDREYADIGDTLTYTVTTTNIGNVNATDILITDELEPDVTLIPDSITITDGNLKPLQYMGTVPSVGLRLTEPVDVGETIILTYQVSVTDIPSTNQISNTSNISYEYIVDNTSNTPVTGSGITKPVITQIQNANLKSNFTKSVDKQYADINDILTYTIVTTNIGNVIANNVKIIDDIPIGTIFNGNITVTDIDGNSIDFSGDNPSTGIIITNGVDAKNTVQVTFQVVVATIPSTQTVVNTAGISYDYEVNLNTVSDGGITNEVSTKINHTNLKDNFKKTVDKEYAGVGDILTYTISTTNTGNTPTITTLDDTKMVTIKDIIQPGTSIIPSSITVKDRYGNNLDYKEGSEELTIILLNPIDVDETVIVTYQVKVDIIPTQNPILNTADITYSYEVDPTTQNIDTDSGATPEAKTTINYAELDVTKEVDKEYADINDILTYTIAIKNNGNTEVTALGITDIIQPGTSFISGSVYSNVEVVGYNPSRGIGIVNPIAPGETITVSYQVRVISIPSSNPIVSTSNIRYRYTIDANNPNGANNNLISNSVSTQVNSANLASFGTYINKTVDKQYARMGDILIYTIVATNTGNTDANNVLVSDTIPTGTTYVDNSITVTDQMGNSIDFGATNPTDIKINESIAQGGTLKVSFQVTVDSGTVPVPNPMENNASISYDYTVNPMEPNGVHTELISLPVLTQVNFANLTSAGNFIKDVDKEYADVGDTLNYKLTIRNTGNTSANSVVITDILPLGTVLIEGSVTSSVDIKLDKSMAKINIINPIYGLDTVIINYQVRVVELPKQNPIQNIATIDYKYTVDPANPNSVNDEGTSNEAVTQINTADLITSFNKSVDNEYAILGDTLNYTINLRNTGNTPATNVVIKDILPSGATLLGPITVTDNDGNIINFTGDIQTTGIRLENPVDPVDQLGLPIITVKIPVKIQSDKVPSPNPLVNSASINYNYTVNPDESDGANASGESNEVLTFIICEDKYIDECLPFILENIKVQNIDLSQSNVEASVVSTQLDKKNLVYKNYGPPTIKVEGYYLYTNINFKYYITYNTFGVKTFNESRVIPVFIPLRMSNSNLYTNVTITDYKLYIDGSRASFYAKLNFRICVSD